MIREPLTPAEGHLIASVRGEFRRPEREIKRLKGSGRVRRWTLGRGNKIKRREDGGQRGESQGELEVVVGWGRCPAAFRSDSWLQGTQSVITVPGGSTGTTSKWKALKVISKIIDSCSVQRKINAGLDQAGQERHFPSSSARDGATHH